MNEEFLRNAVGGAFRLLAFWNRQQDRLSAFLEGLAMSVLSPRTLGKLTFDMYGDHPASAWHSDNELNRWEDAWISSDLPAPPAHVLVGGAGKGREVRVLQERGYRVTAFEPVPDFVRQAPALKDVTFLCGSYEDLAEPDSAAAGRFCHAIETNAPYDAVLLGWGSFSHVPTAGLRAALLKKLRKLCPSGPVLVSFFMDPDHATRDRRRAWKLGYQVGRTVARKNVSSLDPGDFFAPGQGLSHVFTEQEFEELATSAGYRVLLRPRQEWDYPHATLRPLAVKNQAARRYTGAPGS
jgi:hypothetical protein